MKGKPAISYASLIEHLIVLKHPLALMIITTPFNTEETNVLISHII